MNLPTVEIIRGRNGKVSRVLINGEKAKNISTSNRMVFATKDFVVKLAKKKDRQPDWAGCSKLQNQAEVRVWRDAVAAGKEQFFATILDHSADCSYILMERVYGDRPSRYDRAMGVARDIINDLEKSLNFWSEGQFVVPDMTNPI